LPIILEMQVVLYKKTRNNSLYYYSLDDRQQSLFHPHALTVRWGTSIDGGRERQYYFKSAREKDQKIRSILKAKLKEYQVLYSYFRDRKNAAGAVSAPDDIIAGLG
jgi:preprotein translocase subunit SecD